MTTTLPQVSTQPVRTHVRRRRAPRLNPRALRWALLAVFPVGYLACERTLAPLTPTFLYLTIVNATACALVLTRLGAPLRTTLWSWMLLLLFVNNYFIKMFWFAWKINEPQYIGETFKPLQWVSREVIFSGYSYITMGFVTLCVTMFVILTFLSGRWRKDRQDTLPAVKHRSLVRLIVIAATVYLVLTVIQAKLGYGVLGFANPVLPFHLGGVLPFVRRSICPAVLLLGVWLFDRSNPRWANLALLIAVGSAVLDSLISTSKGSVLSVALPILFLWLLTHKFTFKRKLAFAVIVLLALTMFQIANTLRSARLRGNPAAGVEAPTVESLTATGADTLQRVAAGGADGVWYSLDYTGSLSVSRVLWFVHPGAMTVYYTSSVVGVSQPNDFRGAGMIAAYMIIGGGLGIVLFTIVVTLGFASLWFFLSRMEIWPVALSLAAAAAPAVISIGGLEILVFVKLLLAIYACRFLFRRFVVRRRPTKPRFAGMVASRPEPAFSS